MTHQLSVSWCFLGIFHTLVLLAGARCLLVNYRKCATPVGTGCKESITEIKWLPAVSVAAVRHKTSLLVGLNNVFFSFIPPSVPLLLGAYVCKGRSSWLMPLGEALWENADLQLCIPMKFKRAPPLPPPPGPAMCALLSDMLDPNPDSRPPADQLEARVRAALKEDSH